ncbi:MAG: ABC transporter permease [Cocleimonas sp.]|nr:ABC transporter permease [Cocleimonas sp.]
MLSYLIRRLLLMIPTLLGITIIVFSVMAAAPGGISAQGLIQGQDLKPAQKKALVDYYNKRYGLDDPAPIQYLRWLNNVSPIGFTFDDDNKIKSFSFTKGSDLGESFNYGRSVSALIKERLPITLLLNVITIPLIYIIAIIIGIKAAADRGGSFDVGSNVLMLGMWSVPSMLIGVLLIGFFANIQHWQWFPTSGLSDRAAQDMTYLPNGMSFVSIAKLFVFMLAGTAIMVFLSQWSKRRTRTVIATVVGGLLGALMAYSHPETLTLNWVLLPLLGAATLLIIAWVDFPALRVGGLGLIGMSIGIVLAFMWMPETPERGYLLDRMWHLVLPVIALSYGAFAFLAKLIRTSVLENLEMDYARTARAKGVSEDDVMRRHVFRNSLLPLITASSGILPGLLAGAVVIESIFSIDGMGKLAIEAVNSRDKELILSITLISGVLTLIGNLIADFLYTVVDPRVSYD